MFFLNLANFSHIQLKSQAALLLHTDIPRLGKRSWAESWKGHEWKEKGKEDTFPNKHIKSLQVSSIRSGKDEVLNSWCSKPHGNEWRNTPGAQMKSWLWCRTTHYCTWVELCPQWMYILWGCKSSSPAGFDPAFLSGLCFPPFHSSLSLCAAI